MVQSLSLSMRYKTEIKGFGEIYEIVSVEALRKRLRRKYGDGTLYLSNSLRSILEDPEALNKISQGGTITITERGLVDCPPWESKPKENGNPPGLLLRFLAGFIFRLLLPFEGYNKPHMVWIFVGSR